MRLWVILPAYNEAENIPAIFEDFRYLLDNTYNIDLRIVLVNDCSTDNTVEVARQTAASLSVQIISNPENLGLAKTFMRGMLQVITVADPRDIIVCMDSDNTHLPGQLMQLVRGIEEGRDLVIASRFIPGAVVKGVPIHRRILSRCMSILFRVCFPIPAVRDYSCGYRAYRAALLKRALDQQGKDLFSANGFACMVSVLLKLHKLDAVCGEIPIVLRYDQKAGLSKLRIGETIFATLKVLIRERFSA